MRVALEKGGRGGCKKYLEQRSRALETTRYVGRCIRLASDKPSSCVKTAQATLIAWNRVVWLHGVSIFGEGQEDRKGTLIGKKEKRQAMPASHVHVL